MSIAPLKMQLEADKVEQTARLTLFTVDLTNLGGGIHRFHNGMNEKAESVIWQGLLYEPFVSKMEGISESTDGPSGRPKFTIANITGVITGMAVQYRELAGAQIYVSKVYAKFLDAVNFVNGNPNADPNQEYKVLYNIERMTSIDANYASFECAIPTETDGVLLPASVITANVCQWIYRGEGCRYSGSNYFNEKDEPVSDIESDKCAHLLNSCVLRFGANVEIPIRMYPSCGKVSS